MGVVVVPLWFMCVVCCVMCVWFRFIYDLDAIIDASVAAENQRMSELAQQQGEQPYTPSPAKVIYT